VVVVVDFDGWVIIQNWAGLTHLGIEPEITDERSGGCEAAEAPDRGG